MDDPWKMLESAAVNALEPIWNELAKDGREVPPLRQWRNIQTLHMAGRKYGIKFRLHHQKNGSNASGLDT